MAKQVIKAYSIELGDQTKELQLVFKMLKTTDSLKFLMYMGKTRGGSVGKVIGAVSGDTKSVEALADLKTEDMNLEKIGNAVFSLFERLDEDDVEEKLNLLLSSVRIDDTPLDINHFLFEGNLDILFKVAKEALVVNYSRFLSGKNGILEKLKASLQVLKDGKS